MKRRNQIQQGLFILFIAIIAGFSSCEKEELPSNEPGPSKEKQSPTCTIKTSPEQNSFELGTKITFTANATDVDGSIINVEFNLDDNNSEVDSQAPYEYTWDSKDAEKGTHSLKVTVTDNDSLTATSTLSFDITSKQRVWTILNYFAGNNNLDDGGYLVNDIQEMEKAGDSDEVTSLVMLNSKKAGGTAKYYKIEKHTDHLSNQILSPVVKDDLGTKDMSDPRTLKDFIEWGIENYPAERYAIVINSHGGGWTGMCPEDNTGELMKMNEFHEALGDVHFDAIIFHSCLMGTVEVAYEISDRGDYMVASEGKMPAISVLAADVWLADLIKEPHMESRLLAQKIAKCVYDRSTASGLPTSIAATDLSKIKALVSDISDFRKNMNNLNHNCWDEVLYAWQQAEITGSGSFQPILRDLGLFVTNLLRTNNDILKIPLLKNSIEAIEESLGDAAFVRWNPAGGFSGDGLSIHFPLNEGYLMENAYSSLQFASDTEWLNFLKEFMKEAPDSYGEAYIKGKVSWPGHSLSDNCKLYVYYFNDAGEFTELGNIGLQSDGSFSGRITGSVWPMEYFIDAFDDLNNNGQINTGEGYGFYDKNGDGEWTTSDKLVLNKGDEVNNINITLMTEKSASTKSAHIGSFNHENAVSNNTGNKIKSNQ